MSPKLDEGEVICYTNGTTNACRVYLRDLRTESLDRVRSILDKDPQSEWLVHNLLFLHMDAEEVEEVKSRLEYFALIDLRWNPISLEGYVDAVFQCRLHEPFLAVLKACRHLTLAEQLVTAAVKRICSGSGTTLKKEEWLMYISVLMATGSQWIEITENLVKHFVQLPAEVLSSLGKAEVLVRATGVICLQPEDYKGTTEIAETVRQLQFDPLKESRNWNLAYKFFREMFPGQIAQCGVDYASRIIKVVGMAMWDMTVDEEYVKTLMPETDKPVKISKDKAVELTYIGDCAHLTELILKKNFGAKRIEEDMGEFVKIVQFLRRFKTPMEHEDFAVDIVNFQTFCKLLRRNLENLREHHLASWFERFCNYEEAVTTPEGCQLAEEVIMHKAGRAVGLKIIAKVMKLPLITEQLKIIALGVLFNERDWPFEFEHRKLNQGVINVIFQQNQAHSRLELNDFETQLNELLSSLGSSESYNKQTHSLEANFVKRVWYVAIQNPAVSAQELLVRAVERPLIGEDILRTLNQFWKLSCPAAIDPKQYPLESRKDLFEYCLEGILSLIVNEGKKISLKAFIPHILKSTLISSERLEEILIQYLQVIVLANWPEKLAPVLELQEALALALKTEGATESEKSISNLFYHLVGVQESTYFATSEYYTVRDMARKIINIIRPSVDIPATAEGVATLPPGLTLAQLVVLHCRSIRWQEVVRSHVLSPEFKTTFIQEFTIKTVADVIFNSSPTEWNSIIKILFEMASIHLKEPLPSFMSVVRSVITVKVPLKTSPLQEAKTGLKDLPRPNLHFLHFGRYLVEMLCKEDSYKFRKYTEEHLKLFNVLLATFASFPDEHQYFHARQLTLLSVLDLLKWIVQVKNDKMRKKLRTKALVLLKVPLGKVAPIAQNITSLLRG